MLSLESVLTADLTGEKKGISHEKAPQMSTVNTAQTSTEQQLRMQSLALRFQKTLKTGFSIN